jgi:hypothetical protein
MATTITVDQGDKIRVTGTFTDPDDDSAVDPTVVKIGFTNPAGTSTVYTYGTDPEVTRVSAGVYRLLISADTAGRYHVRAWSTGTGQAAESGTVIVKAARVTA